MATDEAASTQDKMMRRQDVVMRSVSAHASGKLSKNDHFALNFVDCIQSIIRETSWTYLHAVSGTNPVEHYTRHGGSEGRDPASIFDGKRYC